MRKKMDDQKVASSLIVLRHKFIQHVCTAASDSAAQRSCARARRSAAWAPARAARSLAAARALVQGRRELRLHAKARTGQKSRAPTSERARSTRHETPTAAFFRRVGPGGPTRRSRERSRAQLLRGKQPARNQSLKLTNLDRRDNNRP